MESVVSTQEIEVTRISDLLDRWISRQVDEEGLTWLQERRQEIAGDAEDWVFFTSFSGVPRYTGKADLKLTADDIKAAGAARPGWDPSGWSVDQAGRTLILLARPADDPDSYVETLEQVFTTADVGESVALYQSLPLLSHQNRWVARAKEGLRSNMSSVFNAVALRNPYPAEHFEEGAWNQMVLKAIFVGTPLYPIQGLDERANPTLARMLHDYAHERWAASREVTPELWRPVGPFAEGELLDDLVRVINEGDPAEQEAAALALSESPAAEADDVLADFPELRDQIVGGELTWETFSRERMAVSG
jgi:hypothetical protein